MRYNEQSGLLVKNANNTTFSICNRSESALKKLLVIGSITLMLLSIIGLYFYKQEFEEFYLQQTNTTAKSIVVWLLHFILLFKLFFFLYNLFLFMKYKPVNECSDNELPLCTIVVPAYNEGQLVYFTLMSVAQSHYPKDKMEIWAIDDGSTDETWYWIKKAKEKLGNRLNIHQQKCNMGKKHALAKGFKEGNGDVFITIDSDSIIEKDTLRQLISPFVNNKKCGAVAGNVRVMNKNQGIIPKMLHVSFAFSFEFIRSAQSSIGFVMCTPGALSAYRKDVLLDVLDEWLNQEFAGKAATIGEDRAITNAILSKGYEVKFQKNAIVNTNTPIDYNGLHKMFTRWSRSDVRETLMMNKFMFKNYGITTNPGAYLFFIDNWLRIIMTFPSIILMFYLLLYYPILILISALSGAFIVTTFQVLFYANYHSAKEAFWAFPYSLFYLFGLFWIAPYSILTVRNSGWLTR